MNSKLGHKKILVLGLGNTLLGDDGLGIRALEKLREQYALPPSVECLDGGVMGLGLLAYLEGMTHLLVLDAVQLMHKPGTLARLSGEEVPKTLSLNFSMHEVGLREILAISELRGVELQSITILGLEPEILEPGIKLSPRIEAALVTLVEAAVAELRQWGIEAEPR